MLFPIILTLLVGYNTRLVHAFTEKMVLLGYIPPLFMTRMGVALRVVFLVSSKLAELFFFVWLFFTPMPWYVAVITIVGILFAINVAVRSGFLTAEKSKFADWVIGNLVLFIANCYIVFHLIAKLIA